MGGGNRMGYGRLSCECPRSAGRSNALHSSYNVPMPAARNSFRLFAALIGFWFSVPWLHAQQAQPRHDAQNQQRKKVPPGAAAFMHRAGKALEVLVNKEKMWVFRIFLLLAM